MRGSPAGSLGGLETAVAQGHVHVVGHVQVRYQVEALEDEADALVADARAVVVVQVAHVLPIQGVAPAVEGLQQARDVEEGRLARAGGAHDRHELTFLHIQAEVAQRVGLHHVGAVDLADVFHL
jgi:hypothetical protein